VSTRSLARGTALAEVLKRKGRFTASFTVLRLLTPLKISYDVAKKRVEPYTKIIEKKKRGAKGNRERCQKPLFASTFFGRPRSRNIASKFHSATLSSPPSIQIMVPDTFFFYRQAWTPHMSHHDHPPTPLYPKGCCIDRLNLPVLSCGLHL
jgi:hypothetical protein